MLFRLEGKVALVTGAASGIGEEAVRLFAENGAFVVVADVQDELGHQVVASIGAERVTFHHCDVRDEKQVEETVSYTLEKYGSIDACGELGVHGIRVNCISPFGVATPLSCRAYNLEPNQVESNSCTLANLKGIVLKARHVAEAALFLASDESAYISGHNLAVDGGFTVVNHSSAI